MTRADTADSPARLRLRAPLLWMLLPLAFGIALARAWPVEAYRFPAPFGLVLAGIALWTVEDNGRLRRVLWTLSFLASVLLLGWSYGSHRLLPRLEEWASLPPRELTATLQVEQIYGLDRHGRRSGIARITDTPPILHELRGQRVRFLLDERRTEAVAAGAQVLVTGVVRRLPLAVEQRSFEAYLASREVYFDLRQGWVRETVEAPPVWRGQAAKLRRWMAATLVEGSDAEPQLRAILPAMLLGERRMLDDSQRSLFRETGMLHLFAVSGLHVGLIAMTLDSLLHLLRLQTRSRAICGMLLLLGYVLVIGAPPSAVRAFLMVLFYWGGRAFMRQGGVLPALVASAVAVLLWQPSQLFDAGAQLSYGIVAGMTLYGFPLAAGLRARFTLFKGLPAGNWKGWHHLCQWTVHALCSYAGVAAGAFVVSVPLSLHYFGVFAPGGLVLNLLMAPLALLCVVAGCLSLLAAVAAQLPVLGLLSGLSIHFNRAGWTSAAAMEWTISAFSRVPGLFSRVEAVAPWQGLLLALAMILLALLLQSREIRRRGDDVRLGMQLLPFATLCICVSIVAAASAAASW